MNEFIVSYCFYFYFMEKHYRKQLIQCRSSCVQNVIEITLPFYLERLGLFLYFEFIICTGAPKQSYLHIYVSIVSSRCLLTLFTRKLKEMFWKESKKKRKREKVNVVVFMCFLFQWEKRKWKSESNNNFFLDGSTKCTCISGSRTWSWRGFTWTRIWTFGSCIFWIQTFWT